MLFRQGIGVVATGVGFGLTAAYFLSGLLGSVLYDVEPRNPGIFLAVPAVLALVAMVAVSIPAYRASRVDPLKVLRRE